MVKSDAENCVSFCSIARKRKSIVHIVNPFGAPLCNGDMVPVLGSCGELIDAKQMERRLSAMTAQFNCFLVLLRIISSSSLIS